jgi:predicted HTH transcriptional regulator
MADKVSDDSFYPEEESKYLEFKSRVSAKSVWKSIAKECVAFANGAGGSVLIGVEDKTRRLRLVESLGSGISVMREEMRRAGLCPPEFDNAGDYLKVVFCFQRLRCTRVAPQDLLKQLMRTQTVITASDLLAAGIAERTASRLLRQAVDEGHLEKRGDRKGARYVVLLPTSAGRSSS